MAHFDWHHFYADTFVQPAHLSLFLPSDRQKDTLILSGISSGLPGALGFPLLSRGSWAGALFLKIEVCPTR